MIATLVSLASAMSRSLKSADWASILYHGTNPALAPLAILAVYQALRYRAA